jgi:hypothetical protein
LSLNRLKSDSGSAVTETKLLEDLNEHVFYELLMLRYSMHNLENAPDRMFWNAMFAAFNVSARNLENFLTNKGDRTHMRILDYKDYRTNIRSISNEPVRKTLEMLNAQCLHMGRDRYKEPDKKINLDRLRVVFKWVTSNMDEFLKSFTEDFRSKLRPEWGHLIAQPLTVRVGPTGPSSSAMSSSSTTSTTGPVEIIQFDTAPKN